MSASLHNRLRNLVQFTYPRPVSLSLYHIAVFAASTRLEASDERDHIYGLIGLLDPESNTGLRPNYTLDPADAFREAMMAMLENVENVDDSSEFWYLLYLAVRCRPVTISLPSWVIYFPYGRGEIWVSLSWVDLFLASKSSKLEHSFEESKSTGAKGRNRYVIYSHPVKPSFHAIVLENYSSGFTSDVCCSSKAY
jgi:hypothetical protein